MQYCQLNNFYGSCVLIKINKNLITVMVCLFVILNFFQVLSASDTEGIHSDVNSYLDNEIQAVENINNGDIANIYFIKVLDGYMPIPSRFILDSSYKDTIVFEPYSEVLYPDHIPGLITIGSVIELDKVAEGLEKLGYSFNDKKYNTYNVKIFEKNSNGSYKHIENLETVIIYDNSQYILLNNVKTRLWKSMIDAHYYLMSNQINLTLE